MSTVRVISKARGTTTLRDVEPGQYFCFTDIRWVWVKEGYVYVMHDDGKHAYCFSSVITPENLWSGGSDSAILSYTVETLDEGTVLEVVV